MRVSWSWCGSSFRRRSWSPLLAGVVLAAALQAGAQGFPARNAAVEVGTNADVAAMQPVIVAESLPEAPQPQERQRQDNNGKPLMAGEPKTVAANTSMPMSPMYSRIIPAGTAAPQIHKWDKITLATRDLYSLTSLADFFVSAGWDQLTNGQPNYGTNSGAFAQRVGAAAIRDSSQAFLSNGPFAVWLHQDPRYFAMGSKHSIPKRAWYAATRALVTRDSSDGHAVVNTSLILGQAAGTALNNLYYPKSNRNFHDNLEGFGGSVGGAALSFVMDEFTSDLLRVVRLKRGESSR